MVWITFCDCVTHWTMVLVITCCSVFSQMEDFPIAEKFVGIVLSPESKLRYEMTKVLNQTIPQLNSSMIRTVVTNHLKNANFQSRNNNTSSNSSFVERTAKLKGRSFQDANLTIAQMDTNLIPRIISHSLNQISTQEQAIPDKPRLQILQENGIDTQNMNSFFPGTFATIPIADVWVPRPTSIPRSSTLSKCRGKTGYVADLEHNCQTFFNCLPDGSFDKLSCPAGLIFDQDTLSCQKSNRAVCSSDAIFDCNGRTGFFGDPFSTDRSSYFFCINGEKSHFRCPEGLFFNENCGACDLPQNCNVNSLSPASYVLSGPFSRYSTQTTANINVLSPTPAQSIPGRSNFADGPQFAQNGINDGSRPMVDFASESVPNLQSATGNTISFTTSSNFDCSGRYGLFSDISSGCTSYWVCMPNGPKHLLQCPAHLRFNELLGSCDFPERVSCNSLLVGGGFCSDKIGFYPDPMSSCKSYYFCSAEGRTYNFTCPGILLYNEVNGACDDPHNVNCMTSRNLDDFDCVGKMGLFADITQGCRVYYNCNAYGKKTRLQCPQAQIFNERLGICDLEHTVICGRTGSSMTEADFQSRVGQLPATNLGASNSPSESLAPQLHENPAWGNEGMAFTNNNNQAFPERLTRPNTFMDQPNFPLGYGPDIQQREQAIPLNFQQQPAHSFEARDNFPTQSQNGNFGGGLQPQQSQNLPPMDRPPDFLQQQPAFNGNQNTIPPAMNRPPPQFQPPNIQTAVNNQIQLNMVNRDQTQPFQNGPVNINGNNFQNNLVSNQVPGGNLPPMHTDNQQMGIASSNENPQDRQQGPLGTDRVQTHAFGPFLIGNQQPLGNQPIFGNQPFPGNQPSLTGQPQLNNQPPSSSHPFVSNQSPNEFISGTANRPDLQDRSQQPIIPLLGPQSQGNYGAQLSPNSVAGQHPLPAQPNIPTYANGGNQYSGNNNQQQTGPDYGQSAPSVHYSTGYQQPNLVPSSSSYGQPLQSSGSQGGYQSQQAGSGYVQVQSSSQQGTYQNSNDGHQQQQRPVIHGNNGYFASVAQESVPAYPSGGASSYGGMNNGNDGVFDCRGHIGYFPDLREDCRVYYYCKADGSKFQFRCPADLKYNGSIGVCDWPANVNCAAQAVGPGNTPTWNESPFFDCQGRRGFFGDSAREYRVFYYCENDGRKHRFVCPSNLRFNDARGACDWSENIFKGPYVGEQEFDCNGKRGYFGNLNTPSVYYLCQTDGLTIKHVCPDNLVFNFQIGSCDWPERLTGSDSSGFYRSIDPLAGKETALGMSTSPGEAQASAVQQSLLKSTVNNSFKCHPGKYGFFADVSASCRKYFYCRVDGKNFSFSCPNNLRFNEKLGACDLERNVPCLTGGSPGFAQISVSKTYFDCNGKTGLINDPDEGCKTFYNCEPDGSFVTFACSDGLAFNSLIGACDKASSVQCKIKKGSNRRKKPER